MINLDKLLVLERESIHVAIERLDNNKAHIVLVIDHDQKLLGTVTDGDVRRGILRGVNVNKPITEIMNPTPVTAKKGQDKSAIYGIMRKKKICQLPIINEMGQVCDLEILPDLATYEEKENIVVLMAGGLSTRLRPLTNDCPKPMLQVGGKPILETILTTFAQFGFYRFYISINYLANQIRNHFGDGSKWGVQIQYIQEEEGMGTAGCLSMLPQDIKQPLIVMNSDLLTKVDFNHLLNFHHEHGTLGTMGVREFDYTVPYGVCKLQNEMIVDIVEKPTNKLFINAGVYVLDPKVLNFIPKNTYFDMPSLFSMMIKHKQPVCAFPIREYWLDIGQLSDFERAHKEYNQVFEIEALLT